MDYLTFRLYGPMASWGQPAVGGDRPTGPVPTRSGLLGLLAAALGIKRDNERELADLRTSVNFGIKQTVPGSLIRDYHTTQVPSVNRKFTYRSRKSELSEDKVNTILSGRDYRCDGLWVVAVTLSDKAVYSLEQLKDALVKPVFLLYLGRKSCPLSLPLMPRVVTAENLKVALDTKYPPVTRSEKEDRLWFSANKQVTYYWQGGTKDLDQTDRRDILITRPWDEPVNRDRWQFSQRVQHQLTDMEGS